MSIYIQLIWAYLKIGLFGFGGGYAMLTLIESEIVKSGWLTSAQFTDIVAISQMTPGPIGINSATYIGYVATGNVVGSRYWRRDISPDTPTARLYKAPSRDCARWWSD